MDTAQRSYVPLGRDLYQQISSGNARL
jgi:hypothetical protein